MSLDHEAKIKAFQERQAEENFSATLARARSITVGTCFNGMTEIIMRGNDSRVLWCPMEQREVVEFIYQLASGIGCSVSLTPRQDFASWRVWNAKETNIPTSSSVASPESSVRSE